MTIKVITNKLQLKSIRSLAFFLKDWKARIMLLINKDIIEKKLEKISGSSSYLFIEQSTLDRKRWKVYKVNKKHKNERKLRIIKTDERIRFLKLLKNLNIKGKDGQDDYLSDLPLSIFRKDTTHCDIELSKETVECKKEQKEAKIQIIRDSNTSKNLVVIILDALSLEEDSTRKIVSLWCEMNKFSLEEVFSPSTVTGASLPCIHTLIPHLKLLIDDYEKWYYACDLEAIPEEIDTVAEILTKFTSHNAAITSFGKSHPFYGYYRGFDYYENINGAMNIHNPSSLDKYVWYYNNSFNSKYPEGHYSFIHDVGVHPPLPATINTNDNSYSSYNYAVKESLRKIELLIKSYEINDQDKNTTYIITADHGSSHQKNHSRKTIKPFPHKVYVPLMIRQKNNQRIEKKEKYVNTCIERLKEEIETVFPEASINAKIKYPLGVKTKYIWLTSSALYPKRKFIYALALNTQANSYIMVKVKRSEIKQGMINTIKVWIIKSLYGKERFLLEDDKENASIKLSLNKELRNKKT